MDEKNIWQAAEDGDLEQVKKLIGLGVDVDSKCDNYHEDYPVCHDIVGGVLCRCRFVDLSVSLCSFCSVCVDQGWTPLHIAALGGHIDIVEQLIKSGADVNLPKMVCSPLFFFSSRDRKCHFFPSQVYRFLLTIDGHFLDFEALKQRWVSHHPYHHQCFFCVSLCHPTDPSDA